MTRTARLSCFWLLSLLWAGCSAEQSDAPEAVQAMDEQAFDVASEKQAAAPLLSNGTARTASFTPDTSGLKIIRSATLRLRVDHYAKRRDAVDRIVREHGAYVSSEREHHYGARVENELTIRVPSAAFMELLNALTGIAESVDAKEISAEDVTEQFVDMQARLKAKKEVERRYLQLLSQAASVEDVLAVEAQLRSIREDVESMEGRLRYLTSRVDYSTVQATLYEGSAATVAAASFWSEAGAAIRSGWQGILAVVLALLHLWPLWLLLGPVAYALYRRRQRSRVAREVAAAA